MHVSFSHSRFIAPKERITNEELKAFNDFVLDVPITTLYASSGSGEALGTLSRNFWIGLTVEQKRAFVLAGNRHEEGLKKGGFF